MLKPKILLLSLTLIISIASIHAKRAVFLEAFTRKDTECFGAECKCIASDSNPDKWISSYEKEDISWGLDHHIYEYYQMSKVITELSSEGFILLTDKYHCPPGVEQCTVRFDESNDFSVTSNYRKISRTSLKNWNKLLQKENSSQVSTTWYECVFEANTTGYLAIRPMVERVRGWIYGQDCETGACAGHDYYPCSECPKTPEACVWLGKAPKINSADNTIEGERRCVTAKNEQDALFQLKYNGYNVFEPQKYNTML